MDLPVHTNMRPNPPIVFASDPISRAIDLMIKQNIGAVIVVANDQYIGLINEKDILERVVKPKKNVVETLVKDVMSKPLISIQYDSLMKEAFDLMQEHNIRRLAVTKKGKLVGIITERRILECISHVFF